VRTEETTEIDGTIFALATLISALNSSKWFFDLNCSPPPKKFSLELGFSAAFSEKRSQPPLETFLIFFKEQI